MDRATTYATQVWRDITDRLVGTVPGPYYCTGPDDDMLFYGWDNVQHHISLEIYDNGVVEFFYRNRDTDEYWGETYRVEEFPPHIVVAAFQQHLPLNCEQSESDKRFVSHLEWAAAEVKTWPIWKQRLLRGENEPGR